MQRKFNLSEMGYVLIDEKVLDDICIRVVRLSHGCQKLAERINLDPDSWLDTKTICRIINVSPRTLQNYRELGVIPFSNINGKILYKVKDVKARLDKLTVKRNSNG